MREILSVNQAAEKIGVSTDTIYNMVREKQIPHFRMRRRIFLRSTSLDEWMRQQEEQSFNPQQSA